MIEEPKKEVNNYKIKCGNVYTVYKSEFAGYTFYKVPLTRKTKDGDTMIAYKSVSFSSRTLDTNIKDNTLIRPLALREDFYFSKSDTKHLFPQFTVVFTDWEIIVNQERLDKEDARQEYITKINTKDIDFNDSDLPF